MNRVRIGAILGLLPPASSRPMRGSRRLRHKRERRTRAQWIVSARRWKESVFRCASQAGHGRSFASSKVL